MKISELDISSRSIKCLESAGILYVDELMDQTDEDLLEILVKSV